MSWKRLFPRAATDQSNAERVELLEPAHLLHAHANRLNALRLESGYNSDQFEELVRSAFLKTAEWIHCLPATRAENHSEAGGLLRLAVETACLAFRRADGKFLAGPVSSDVRHRERDRVWRYAALLGGMFRSVGRCVTHVRATSAASPLTWNPLQEGLWAWQRRIGANRIQIDWRDGTDARPTASASAWLAARIIPNSALAYLQSADDTLPELLLRVINGDRSGRVCEIVDEAYQAAIDHDIARRGSDDATVKVGVQLEYRLLDALRGLVREKWTMNSPGSRLWCTQQGVFLTWKPAVNDMLMRMRAEGINGLPRDPDIIAELLIEHGVLVANPSVTSGLKHYHKLLPQVRGAPKQSLEVVRIADAELIGLQVHGVDPIPAEIVGSSAATSSEQHASSAEPEPLQLPLEREDHTREVVPLRERADTPPALQPASPKGQAAGPAAQLDRLKRFGLPGAVLQKLAEHVARNPDSKAIARTPDGIAIAYPDGVAPHCPEPQEFLASCEAQGLLVPEDAAARRFVRTRKSDERHLPLRYIVLAPRIARHLSLPTGEKV